MTGPRRFFQLHLSTALVLMVLAGGLLGANLIEYRHRDRIRTVYIRGWPWKLDAKFRPTTSSEPALGLDELEKLTEEERRARNNFGRYRFLAPNRSSRIVGNVAVALGILTITGILLEWRLRLKENV